MTKIDKLELNVCEAIRKLRDQCCKDAETKYETCKSNGIYKDKCELCKHGDRSSSPCSCLLVNMMQYIIPSSAIEMFSIENGSETFSFGDAWNFMSNGTICMRKSEPTVVYTIKNGVFVTGIIDNDFTDDFHISWKSNLFGFATDKMLANDWIKITQIPMFSLADDIYVQELEKLAKLS